MCFEFVFLVCMCVLSLFFLCAYVCFVFDLFCFPGARGGGSVDPPEGTRPLSAEDERALGVEGEERWRSEAPAGGADRLAQVSARSLPGITSARQALHEAL